MKKVICVDTSKPENWIMVENEDFLTVGEVYTVEEEIINEDGNIYYCLLEKPVRNHGEFLKKLPDGSSEWVENLVRIKYNSERFIDLPKSGEIPKIESKPEVQLTPEEEKEEFIRKMKFIGMSDEDIQTWLNLIDFYAKKEKG